MRRLSVSIYLLVALAELLHWAIVPLLPAFAARFSLSEVQTGALVACTGLATLVISLPAGVLADRLGARRLTLWAGVALALSALGQAVAPSYALLLVARLAMGFGFGIVWTAGLAWLSAAAPADRPPAALGVTVTSAGVGIVVAPGFAGVVAEPLGLAAPFLIAGAVTAVVTGVLTGAPPGRPQAAAPERPSLGTARAAGREPGVLAALAAILLGGLAGGMISVLAPLELHAAGLSGASIGLAFSVAALVFIAASAVTVRLGERAISTGVVLAAAAAFALALSPATASGTAVAVLAAMVVSAPLRALLFTASYPLGAAHAPRAGVGAGTVLGVLNATWALTAVAGPLAGGALTDLAGARVAYGLLQVLALTAVATVWLHARRQRVAPALGI